MILLATSLIPEEHVETRPPAGASILPRRHGVAPFGQLWCECFREIYESHQERKREII